jgi:PAS domain S-box-containing protein
MRTFYKIIGATLIFLILLSVVGLYFWYASVQKVSEEMIQTGESIAIGLSGETMKELKGIPEDEETIAFKSIHKRLGDFKKLNEEVTFVYIYTKKGDDLVFMVDAEPKTSSDYIQPGEIYEEADGYYFVPFQNKEPFVTPAVSDRWGTWVSTLVPILDEQGEVKFVLGIDIDEKDWFWKIICEMKLPMIISILIILGLLAFLFSSRGIDEKQRISLKRLFVPFLFFLVLIVAIPGYLFLNDEKNEIQEWALRDIEKTKSEIYSVLEQQELGLIFTAKAISNNKDVQKDLIEGNVANLFKNWEQVFYEMRETGNVTHLYFFDKDRTCILRVHNVEKSGDFIDRFTARTAEETRSIGSGLEIGPLGTFTLRVVNPIFLEEEIVGYVEVGKEIEDVMDTVYRDTNNPLILILNKDSLRRESWESGMAMLGREANWDKYEEKVVIYKSIDFPQDLLLVEKEGTLKFNNREWVSRSFPKFDASGKVVGDMFILSDISNPMGVLLRTMSIGGAISVILIVIMSYIAYIILHRTDLLIEKQKEGIKEALDRFSKLSEKSKTFLWEVDEKGKYKYVSENVKDVIGYSAEELINKKTVFDLHPQDGLKEFKKGVLKTLSKKEEVKELENAIVSKKGEIVWVLSAGMPILDEKGNLINFRGSDTDISKIKAVEISLFKEKKELEKFQLAVQGASDHIVITDHDGICLYMNDAAEKTTGFKRKEVLGKKVGTRENWGGLMDKKTYEKLWKRIKKDKKVFIGEVRNKRKNGELYDAKANIAPIVNEKGKVAFFVGIERDVTKEKQIDKAKTEFVSLASHQLRTPLSAINWYVEMLMDGDAGEINKEQKKYLDEIYAGNQRMVTLVNSLLNVSRLELGTFMVEPEEVDIIDLSKSVVGELKPKTIEKKQKIKENYAKKLPKIKADPKLLRIILQNLLSNSAKYTPEKGEIEVEIKPLKKGTKVQKKIIKEESIFIKISDNGYGIPQKQQNKIFTKLFRAENITDKDAEGTGLGLYIIKEIVDHSKGMIWFESKEDKGTAFYVVLPLKGMKKKEGTRALE